LGGPKPRAQVELLDGAWFAAAGGVARVGLYPIATLQYSSTTLYQVSYHIQYLFF
jgi:hypothetical protein